MPDYHDPVYTDDADNPQGVAVQPNMDTGYHDPVYSADPNAPQGLPTNTVSVGLSSIPWGTIAIAAAIAFFISDDESPAPRRRRRVVARRR